MPPKIRELITALEQNGFENRGGKGSHKSFTHANLLRPITISGTLGEDTKPYQLKAVAKAIKESKQ